MYLLASSLAASDQLSTSRISCVRQVSLGTTLRSDSGLKHSRTITLHDMPASLPPGTLLDNPRSVSFCLPPRNLTPVGSCENSTPKHLTPPYPLPQRAACAHCPEVALAPRLAVRPEDPSSDEMLARGSRMLPALTETSNPQVVSSSSWFG